MIPHPWNAAVFAKLTVSGRGLPHAMLVEGREGIGKHALADALVKWLLCERPAETGSCGNCNACNWFERGNHPDFRLVEPKEYKGADDEGQEARQARFITIDQIRELAVFLGLTSHRGGAKVLLIDPAEAMHPAAANALLKMLEEPPPGVYWLLVSHEPGRLLPTVVSRCRRVPVPLPSAVLAVQWLRGQGMQDPALWLALAGGAPLTALEIADTERQTWRRRFLETLVAPEQRDWLEDGRINGTEAEWCVRWLQQWVYDLLAIRLTGKQRYHLDQADAVRRLSASASLPALLAFERRLRKAVREVRHPLNFSLFLDDLYLSYLSLLETGHE
jgi:DNA polymerase III subunit delta'